MAKFPAQPSGEKLKRWEIAAFIDEHTVDGDHHKQWVLDQVLRMLLGRETYKKWREVRSKEGYDWDEGTPP